MSSRAVVSWGRHRACRSLLFVAGVLCCAAVPATGQERPDAPVAFVRTYATRLPAAWRERLAHGAPAEREEAALVMRGGGPEVVSPLLEALGDSVEAVVRTAAGSLGYFPDYVRYGAERALFDADAPHRAWGAGQVLGRLGRSSQDVLLRALVSPAARVRSAAIRGFAWADTWDAEVVVPALRMAMRDSVAMVCRAATAEVRRIEERRARQEAGLLTRARDSSALVRTTAMGGLGELKGPSPRVVETLLRGLRDPVCDVWAAAASALHGLQERPGVVRALARAVRRRDGREIEPSGPGQWTRCDTAREHTISALTQVGAEAGTWLHGEVDGILAGFLTGADETARLLTLDGLYPFDGPAVRAALWRLMDSSHGWSRAEAVHALRYRDSTSTAFRERLVQLADDTSHAVRWEALHGLDHYGAPGWAAMLPLLQSPVRGTRVLAGALLASQDLPDSTDARLSHLSGCETPVTGRPWAETEQELAGRWRLVMVGPLPALDTTPDATEATDTVARGLLELWVADTLHRYARTPEGARMARAEWYTPLSGATTLDPGPLGARSLPVSLGSRDPARPGLSVVERLPEAGLEVPFSMVAGATGESEIWLALVVEAVTERGMRGWWHYGFYQQTVLGLWCAEREP